MNSVIGETLRASLIMMLTIVLCFIFVLGIVVFGIRYIMTHPDIIIKMIVP